MDGGADGTWRSSGGWFVTQTKKFGRRKPQTWVVAQSWLRWLWKDGGLDVIEEEGAVEVDFGLRQRLEQGGGAR